MATGDTALLKAAVNASERANVSRILLRSAHRRLAELEQLPPLPTDPRNRIAELDCGPCANPAALDNEAFYIPSLNGPPEDRSVFERLMTELDFHTCWLNTGMQFSREICLGNDEVLMRSPTYSCIIQRVTEFFGVKPVRTLVNLYRNGDDWCNLHSDQYHQGGYPIDLTVGSTFGDTRKLIWVEKRNSRHRIEVPQRNGDVFAFSDRINGAWRHMIPQEPDCGPRISVIVWCNRFKEGEQPAGQNLGSFPHMLYHNPKGNGQDFVAMPGGRSRGRGRGENLGRFPHMLQHNAKGDGQDYLARPAGRSRGRGRGGGNRGGGRTGNSY